MWDMFMNGVNHSLVSIQYVARLCLGKAAFRGRLPYRMD